MLEEGFGLPRTTVSRLTRGATARARGALPKVPEYRSSDEAVDVLEMIGTVIQSMDAGHLKPDTDPEQLVGEIYSLAMGQLHDLRFLRDARATDRANATWQRLRSSYLK